MGATAGTGVSLVADRAVALIRAGLVDTGRLIGFVDKRFINVGSCFMSANRQPIERVREAVAKKGTATYVSLPKDGSRF